jgi:hypothetical protein
MTVAQAIGFGIVAGIALFFVLQRAGLLDKWIERWDR